jgi:membrane protease YdiL (CAAX protease family)
MKARIVALTEVVAVFVLTMLAIAVVGPSPAAAWVRRVTHRAFLEYVAMIAAPLLILLVTRRNLASAGVSLRNMRAQLNIAVTAFIPVAVAGVAESLVDYRGWNGALILLPVQVALLFALGFLLRRKPTLGSEGVVAGVALVGLAGRLAAKPTVGNAFSALLFYVFFLGLGEELLFRGYIQSRLNMAFGRPFTFFGVQWGWGAVIAAALFGLMHVLNLGSLATGQWTLTPWWGLWTFVGGLVLAFVREKTGSIVAPTLLHGLPQGIAYAFMGM